MEFEGMLELFVEIILRRCSIICNLNPEMLASESAFYDEIRATTEFSSKLFQFSVEFEITNGIKHRGKSNA